MYQLELCPCAVVLFQTYSYIFISRQIDRAKFAVRGYSSFLCYSFILNIVIRLKSHFFFFQISGSVMFHVRALHVAGM